MTNVRSDVCSSYLSLATRNNRGGAHENGSIEGPQAHLKRRLDQALRRRGSRDFVSIEAWREFVEAQVARQNRRHAARIDAERRVLKALPARRTTDFAMVTVDVTRNGTVAVQAEGVHHGATKAEADGLLANRLVTRGRAVRAQFQRMVEDGVDDDREVVRPLGGVEPVDRRRSDREGRVDVGIGRRGRLDGAGEVGDTGNERESEAARALAGPRK